MNMPLSELRPILLRRMVTAVQCRTVEVRVIDQHDSVVARRRGWSRQQFQDAHGWMAARSAERLHVYFRPDGPLSWVLVDDLTQGMVTLMRDDGLHPTVVVETNQHTPDNLQAWVCIGRDEPRDVVQAAARLLANRYGADAAAALPMQFGRVPGMFNAKPRHWRDGEKPPLVKLLVASTTGVSFAFDVRTEAREWAANERERREHGSTACLSVRLPSAAVPVDATDTPTGPATVDEVTGMLAEATHRHCGDRSGADFAVACLLLGAGETPERVAALLMACSAKAAQRESRKHGAGAAYVQRTVHNATRAVMA